MTIGAASKDARVNSRRSINITLPSEPTITKTIKVINYRVQAGVVSFPAWWRWRHSVAGLLDRIPPFTIHIIYRLENALCGSVEKISIQYATIRRF